MSYDEVAQLRGRLNTMIAERDAERKMYNDGIASHLAEIARLERHIKDLRELREFDRVEIERLRVDWKPEKDFLVED